MTTIRELGVKISYIYDKTKADTAERDINDIKKGLQDIETGSTRAANVANRNMDSMASSARRTGGEIARIGDTLETWGNRLNALAAFAGIGFSIGGMINMVDQWKIIAGQVRLVTNSQEEAKATQEELYAIAGRTRQEYAATAGLFTSIARNASELGKSNSDILAFTEDVSNAMLLGGGDQASQQAALVQLGQALGSGTLRGDELNSIMEQAPRLAKAIAEGMGTTIGQLRNMGAEGKLTSVMVFNAIRSQTQRLKMEMGQIPWTVGQATAKVGNAFGRMLNRLEERTGIVSSLAENIAKLGDYIDSIDITRLVTGLKMAAIYATAFFVANKWGAITKGMGVAVRLLRLIRNGYALNKAAALAFNIAFGKGALVATLAMAKFLLVAAAITAIVLVVQDLYYWITGGKSVIGEYLGSWDDFCKKAKQWFSDFAQSVKDAVNEWIIEPLKTALSIIDEILTRSLPLYALGKKVYEYFNEPEPQSSADYWAGRMLTGGATNNNRSYSDARRYEFHTNVNVASSNASPQEIGDAVNAAQAPVNPFSAPVGLPQYEAGW